MDSGFLAEGESLEDEYDVSQPLLPEEVLGLMDQILCHEVNSRIHNLSSRTTEVDSMSLIGRMAHGLPIIPDAFHLHLHQSTSMATTALSKRGSVHFGPHISGIAALGTSSAPR